MLLIFSLQFSLLYLIGQQSYGIVLYHSISIKALFLFVLSLIYGTIKREASHEKSHGSLFLHFYFNPFIKMGLY